MSRKTFLVTGGTSGIGLAIAKRILLSDGELYVLSRNRKLYEANLFSWASERGLAVQLNWINLDFTDLESVTSLAVNDFPRFDGLVNSAGVLKMLPLKLESLPSLLDTFSVNLIGPMELIRVLLRAKLLKSGASLVLLSSINGVKIGAKAHSVYAATKAGITGFAMSLANELSSLKIRVNTVAPGMVLTGMSDVNKAVLSGDDFKDYLARYPLGTGDAGAVADTVMFLLCHESRWITGQQIVVDGGFTLN